MQPIPTPWYQYPVLDFVTENLVPGEIRDERIVEYQLQPQTIVPAQQLLERGENLRHASAGPQLAVPPAGPVYNGPPSARPGLPASPPPATRPAASSRTSGVTDSVTTVEAALVARVAARPCQAASR